jgi:hypothetical protein
MPDSRASASGSTSGSNREGRSRAKQQLDRFCDAGKWGRVIFEVQAGNVKRVNLEESVKIDEPEPVTRRPGLRG